MQHAGDGGWAERADGAIATFAGHSLADSQHDQHSQTSGNGLPSEARRAMKTRVAAARRDSRAVQDLDLHRHPCKPDSPA